MRRPSPLPQPAAQRPAEPGPTGLRRDQPAAPADVVSELDPDEHPTAPIIPITAPITLTPGRPAPLPDAPATSPAADADAPAEPAGDPAPAEPVRLAEVWAAARARRKALRAEVRRFTVRQRRRRAVWIGAAASVVILALVTIGAAYSPLFAVERIRVVGAEQLDPAAVEGALAGQLGTALPLVDESAVKAALVTFPLVESYSLEARPPHELVVRIVERTPIGYLETSAGYTLVDAAGVALSTAATAGSDAPLLTVEGGRESGAFEAVGQVIRSLPESIRVQVTAVSASTPDDVTLTLGGTDTRVVWGSAEDSAMKAVSLASMMLARPPATVIEYDVSSPTAVVVR